MNRPGITRRLLAGGTLCTALAAASLHGAGLAESARDVDPVGLGQQMPDASVRTLDGSSVQLADLLEGQKALFIVFRGGWCPFCTRHLADLQSVYPRLQDMGYKVYALAPDTPDSMHDSERIGDLDYTILLDPEMAAIQALGLAFAVDAATVEKYKGYGITLLSAPGTSQKVLPVPAVYLVDADGVIQFAHWEADYKQRLDADAVLAVAEGRLQAKPVRYRHADTALRGYLAYDPSQEGTRPGVLVIHEWYGLNAYAKRRCRQLAQMGYVAFAADMYGNGKVVTTAEEAGKLAGALRSDRPLMRQRAARALQLLKDHARVDANRTAAIGYCFGGGGVLELARSGAALNGVVSFHGNLDTPNPDQTPQPKAAILVCHGAADPHVPPEAVDAFREEMHGCNADWQLNMYGGAVHSFTNPDSGDDPSTGVAYDEQADRHSWRDMQAFFDEVFRPDDTK